MKSVLLILFFLFVPYHFMNGFIRCEIDEIHQSDKSTQIKANLKQGKYMMSQGNYTGAKAKFQKVLSLDRNHAEAKRLLSQCEQRLNGANKKSPSSSSTSSTKPSSTNNSTTLSVNNTSYTYTAEGGTSTLVVRSNTSWSIGVQPASWVHTTRSSNEITIRVDKNNSTSSRTDYFTIKAGNKSERINISQSGGSAPYLTLSTYNVNFSSSGGSQTINVNTNCSWDIAVKTNSWGHLTKYGNTLTLRVDANSSSTQRTDYFTIKAGGVEKRVNITQSGSYSSYNSSPSYSSYSNNYNNYRSYTYYNNWLKDHSHIGITMDIEEDVSGNQLVALDLGVLYKLGNYDDIVNVTLGAMYRYYVCHADHTSYQYGDTKLGYYNQPSGHAFVIPLNVKFNICNIDYNNKFYIGCAYNCEIGISDSDNILKNGSSISPQIGICSEHWDFAGYYKPHITSEFKVKGVNTQYIGCLVTYYF